MFYRGGGLSAQIKAQIKGTANYKLYRRCLSGPSNGTFSCIKGGQVVSVLGVIDCVSAKGNQKKSPAQNFFFRTTGIETQIITRMFLSERLNGTLSQTLYHNYMRKAIPGFRDEKGSSYLRTSVFSDVSAGYVCKFTPTFRDSQ